VQVEDDVEPLGLAPADHIVEPAESLLQPDLRVIFDQEKFEIERNAQVIEAEAFEIMDVLAGDIVVAETLPESVDLVRPGQLLQRLVDEPERVDPLELKHIALGIEPVAEVGAAEQNLLSVAAADDRAIHPGKVGGLGKEGGNGQ